MNNDKHSIITKENHLDLENDSRARLWFRMTLKEQLTMLVMTENDIDAELHTILLITQLGYYDCKFNSANCSR